MKRFNSIIPILTLIAIVLVSFSASCDRRNPPPILPPEVPQPSADDVLIIHKISANPDTIYADFNITYSTISVEVRDGEGFGVANQTVKFRSHPIGRMITTVKTDSTGIARSTFWDDGQSGIANITAVVRKFHESISDSLVSADTLSTIVVVEETPMVDRVTLHFENLANPFPMRVSQVTPIYATALYSNEQSVSDGTRITFECQKGKFQDAEGNDLGQHISRATYNGRASVFYNAGTSATTSPDSPPEVVKAKIGTVEDSRNIQIRPGSPANIDLRSLVQVEGVDIPADTSHVSSTNHIYMEATITDLYNNVCPSQNIKFSTDLGSFMNTTQNISIPTNVSGVARVRFTPGLFAGAATIGAAANNDTLNTQIIFTITSDEVHSIDFTQQDQINLNVANTGGMQSAVLRVKLRDINGNLIDKPQQVFFSLVGDVPGNANLNNYAPTDTVEVTSNGGEAQVSVNAGTESGVLVIRASCFKENGEEIWAMKPNILIQAGPPHKIMPFIGGFNTGTDMGGGVWRVVAGAHVKDRWNNPVQDNTSVQFSLLSLNSDDPNPTIPPAQIQSQAFVGNVSVNGDSLAGVAYTVITYNGIRTNELIRIKAETGSDCEPGIETVKLPLNDPRFEIQVIPQFVSVGEDAPPFPLPDYKEADILVSLTDGQGLPITSSEIILTSTRGQILLHPDHHGWDGANPVPNDSTYTQTPPNYADTGFPYKITTYESNAHGRIRVYRLEFPIGDGLTNTPSTTDVAITGRLMGTNVQATTNLLVYRYPGPPPF